jgi:hypothetical protein
MGTTNVRVKVMKKTVFLLALAVALCLANSAQAGYNWNAKFQLHYAGAHDSKNNTCSFAVTTCSSEIVVNATGAPGARYDIYIVAIDTDGIAGLRYGLGCTGSFFFYGWTKCSDFEIPTAGWPGCGEGNAQTWVAEQSAGHVTVGIIDLYIYAESELLCTADDPRKGFAEWCDGTSPEPLCNKTTDSEVDPGVKDLYFGCVGFNGTSGVSRCDEVATEKYSWGAIKSLYH